MRARPASRNAVFRPNDVLMVKTWDPCAHPLRIWANRTRSATVTVTCGSTLRFRYLAEGGRWFDDETVGAPGRDAVIAV